MSLAAGTRLGPYEITGILGAGGMGEVYRARDTKLRRDVAVKILPDVFAADLDRLARFEREAQVLASLNHPNIAAIYGFEEASVAGAGVSRLPGALVLELVEGPTLADRIAQGPVAVREALSIATQIAEALQAAHEHGIIHRDLKPANIKLTTDGVVKVLDFGLAKAFATTPHPAGQSMSPTITSPAVMTGAGVVLGTAAYMAPEQAKGRPADKRSDVWGFGCVLYETLTGKRAFEGEDVAESSDGTLLFYEVNPTTSRDVLTATLSGEAKTRPVSPASGAAGRRVVNEAQLLQTPFDDRHARISPDGRWMAYESDSSGRFEVYVRTFPNVGGGQWRISTAGGTRPVWARNGRELFYFGPDGALMRVASEVRDQTWSSDSPTKVLEPRYFTGAANLGGSPYDVSLDGQRFLMIKQVGSDGHVAPPQIVVVKNWFQELRRLVPVN